MPGICAAIENPCAGRFAARSTCDTRVPQVLDQTLKYSASRFRENYFWLRIP
jgi:hypothetical protein